MEYKVIALDMDGTVLNDKKVIDDRTKKAIHYALAEGKEVVFCSGRSYAEMEDILVDFPDMHYLCGASGALVYDLERKRAISKISVDQETVKKIRDMVRDEDIMMHIISEGRALINRSQVKHMAHYQMGIYQEMFERVSTLVEDVFDTIEREQCNVEKINLFCASEEIRAKMLGRMIEQNLPLTMVCSEIASLECSPLGLNKAVGLRRLCQELGITMEEVIMVGDANNDIAALEAVGLAVAMGNANEQVKAVSDVVVSDNNHFGCVEAIERFLLGIKG